MESHKTCSPDTLIIILNWKQPVMTVECVKATIAMAGFDEFCHILVIDNGSGDDSIGYLKEHLTADYITITSLPKNLGFGGGNNFGLNQAIKNEYKYALLLNNDAFPDPHMYMSLREAIEEGIGLYSPKIFFRSEPERIWFAGGDKSRWTLDITNTGRHHLDGPQWSNSRDVDYLLGTCLLVELEAAGRVGLFDPRYFMYFEDLDWSIRFASKGYRLRLVAPAKLYHEVAVSSGGLESPTRIFHLARGSVIFWGSHAQIYNGFLILLFRVASAAKKSLIYIRKRRFDLLKSYYHGLYSGLTALFSDTKKRSL